ncbi:MAG: CotH kinase family protein [Saprospiraceae bacterium]
MKYFLIFITLYSSHLCGQNVKLDSSNLPICLIDTKGQTILNEPKILAKMKIIYNGPGKTNRITDNRFNYNNNIAIEIRGNSSQSYPQKQYGFELRDSATGQDLDTSLINLPSEEDWVLYAPYNDISLLRNALTYKLWNEMGHWGPRVRFCELILNGNYQGIYLLTESIKRGPSRVDIAKMKSTDTSGIELTGGYIMKIDKVNNAADKSFVSKVKSTTGQNITWLYHYPDPGNLKPSQENYIHRYIDTVEQLIASSGFADPIKGYSKYLSTTSFIDYFILTELTRNIDAYKASSFFYKEKLNEDGSGGQFKAGPVWDYNFGYGNASFCSGAQTNGWMYNGCTPATLPTPTLWKRLLDDPNYANELKCRYRELRKTILDTGYIFNFIKKYAFDTLNIPQKRHFDQWKILGTNPGGFNAYVVNSYAEEINRIRTWITARLSWMDTNMPGQCGVVQARLKVDPYGPCHMNNVPTLPLSQPFNIAPYDYKGLEKIRSASPDVIQWVLVELRDKNDSTRLVDRRAVLVKRDSTLADTNLVSLISFPKAVPYEEYLVVVRFDSVSLVVSRKKIKFPNAITFDLGQIANTEAPQPNSTLQYNSHWIGQDTFKVCRNSVLVFQDSLLSRLGYPGLNWATGPSALSGFPVNNQQWQVMTDNEGIYNLVLYKQCPSWYTTRSSVTVEVLKSPIPVITGSVKACSRDTVLWSVGRFQSVRWNTGDSIPEIKLTGSGIYTVTVTDANGCTGESAMRFERYPGLNGTIYRQILQDGRCLLIFNTDSSKSGLQFLWSNGIKSDSVITDLNEIQLTVTDVHGCSYNFSASCQPSNNTQPLTDHLLVYPNPADREIFIESSNPIVSLSITTLQGESVISYQSPQSAQTKLKWDVSEITPGVFQMIVQTTHGVLIRKIVIDH